MAQTAYKRGIGKVLAGDHDRLISTGTGGAAGILDSSMLQVRGSRGIRQNFGSRDRHNRFGFGFSRNMSR
ncbi:hypothetical protein WQE_36395 [Paraburkholderia hospita]|uniref:Uncharacterized protein n=1 Tax=Paraburkholderia hospita TaxID=169430 RepID=A0AAN1JE62_9BURK|nr:hypothetical protein C2L64_23335 [Paraburkholderia hospita]EIM96013.1 hypothetical protein WQE_36395 [Paraburkholderia hospita]OUL75447.1 hypothetical protein CA602_36555 [Paraburkholderia hospita]